MARRSSGHGQCWPACDGDIETALDQQIAWLHARDLVGGLYSLSRPDAQRAVEGLLEDEGWPPLVRAMALRALPDFELDDGTSFDRILRFVERHHGLEFGAFAAAAMYGTTAWPSGLMGESWGAGPRPYIPLWQLRRERPDPDFPGRRDLRDWLGRDHESVRRLLDDLEGMRLAGRGETIYFLSGLSEIDDVGVRERAAVWIQEEAWRPPPYQRALRRVLDRQ